MTSRSSGRCATSSSRTGRRVGAQQSRDLLKSTVANFQQIVDYNTARLRVGTIAEQDVLRVQLEGERLAITANLAALRASRAEADLLRQIGDASAATVTLTESLDAAGEMPPATTETVLMQRPEMKIARASLEEARARARLQDALARPDLTLTYGYKRTQLPDTAVAANTSIAAIAVRLPLFDRNAGNRAAASAETRRQEALLAATQLDVLARLPRGVPGICTPPHGSRRHVAAAARTRRQHLIDRAGGLHPGRWRSAAATRRTALAARRRARMGSKAWSTTSRASSTSKPPKESSDEARCADDRSGRRHRMQPRGSACERVRADGCANRGCAVRRRAEGGTDRNAAGEDQR